MGSHLVLANRHIGICVHRGHTRVPLLRDVVSVLMHRRSRYNNVRLDLFLRYRDVVVTVRTPGIAIFMSVWLSNAIPVHLLMTEVSERVRSMKCMAIGMLYQGLAGRRLAILKPLDLTIMFWRCWRLADVRIRCVTIVQFRGMDATLVGAPLMLDHGGLTAKTKYF